MKHSWGFYKLLRKTLHPVVLSVKAPYCVQMEVLSRLWWARYHHLHPGRGIMSKMGGMSFNPKALELLILNQRLLLACSSQSTDGCIDVPFL